MRLRIFAFILLTLAVGTVVSGCKSSFASPWGVRGIRVDRPMFKARAVKLSDSTVRISIVGPARLRTEEPGIRWVDAYVGPDEDNLRDSIGFSVQYSGVAGSSATLTVVGDGIWDTDLAKRSQRVVADIGALTGTHHLIYRYVLEFEEAEAMELVPFTTPIGEALAEIGCHAKRFYVPPGEHLPSSENFRVIISDSTGRVVWRSDAGSAFLSVVTTVEPQVPNTSEKYSIEWNGVDLSGQPVPDGRYGVEMIIPAKPKSYRTKTEILWPVR